MSQAAASASASPSASPMDVVLSAKSENDDSAISAARAMLRLNDNGAQQHTATQLVARRKNRDGGRDRTLMYPLATPTSANRTPAYDRAGKEDALDRTLLYGPDPAEPTAPAPAPVPWNEKDRAPVCDAFDRTRSLTPDGESSDWFAVQAFQARLLIKRAIDRGVIAVVPCDLSRLISTDSAANVMPPDARRSASDSLVVLGKLKYTIIDQHAGKLSSAMTHPILQNFGLALKIRFAPKRADDGFVHPLDYEEQFYKRVVHAMMVARYTPHLIALLGSFECHNIRAQLQATLTNPMAARSDTLLACQLLATIRKLKTKYGAKADSMYDFDQMRLLLLERSSGATLYETMASPTNPWDQASIIIQVLWTLACFDELGVRHNDLHSGNIWVETANEGDALYFFSKDDYIELPCDFLVKIFDFDRASTYGPETLMGPVGNGMLHDNPKYCATNGMCNFQKNSKFDCFLFLSILWRQHTTDAKRRLHPLIAEWMTRQLRIGKGGLLDVPWTEWPFPGHLCKRTGTYRVISRDGKPVRRVAECNGGFEPDDAEWPSNMTLIRSLATEFGWLRRLDRDGIPQRYLDFGGQQRTYALPSVGRAALRPETLRKFGR